MISTETILKNLLITANRFSIFAIIWHILFFLFIILLLLNWRPNKKIAGILLTIQLVSVCIFSMISKNPFNGIIFLLFSILLFFFGIKLPDEKIDIKFNINFVIGILMIFFGLIYPHFLENSSLIKYLYAAPVGLIPCPTLSIVIGFTLLFNQFEKKAWSIILSIAGIFYGLTGILMLKVYLDIGLLFGAIALLILTFRMKKNE